MIATHPQTGVQRAILGPLHGLWSLLFGPFY